MQITTIHQKLPTAWGEREKLRDKGQFWTPAWIARAMVAYVAETTDLVFDPAAGEGAFFEALLGLGKPSVKYYGVDVDANVLNSQIYCNARCNVELRNFIENPPTQKFDAIVSNPPYIRHHRLDEKTKAFLKKLCQKITGFTIDGRAGYHVYFLLQALNSLDENGKLAIILPADVCEGLFARKLWSWIADKFCLEAVITFDRHATPFPGVDTNAIVAFIKKAQPNSSLSWVKVNEHTSLDLTNFVLSNFKQLNFSSLEIVCRELREAIRTGLSRPAQKETSHPFCLENFARVMRGIATGANEFFFLTGEQAKELGIPSQYLKRAIGRTKDVTGDTLTIQNLKELDDAKRPTYLLSVDGQIDLPKAVLDYLKTGEELNLPNRSLIKQRNPWYKMEQRAVPSLLFAYLGRRNVRFIKNEANVLPLTSFLCIYPFWKSEQEIENLWKALNHQDTLQNLRFVGKSYGSGAIKVEPRSLDKLVIPQHVIEQFEIKPVFQKQANLFS